MPGRDSIFRLRENARRVPRVLYRTAYQNLLPRSRARLEDRYISGRIDHVAGPVRFRHDATSPVVAAIVRDAEAYVDVFVDHYRSIGASDIVVVDNGSTDGTLDRFASYEGVAVHQSMASFRFFERAMRRYVINRYGTRRWCLCVDHDELFDYPRSDVLSLAQLLGYLDAKQYSAVVSHMLDLFPDRPLGGPPVEGSSDFRRTNRYYDLNRITAEPYAFRGNWPSNPRIRTLRGGIRAQHFGLRRILLTKHPLFKVDGRVRPYFNDVHEVGGAILADITAVLYHYKFLPDFAERVASALDHKQYWGGSLDYRYYDQRLQQTSSLTLREPTARQLRGPNPLIREGFLVVSESFERYADGRQRATERSRPRPGRKDA